MISIPNQELIGSFWKWFSTIAEELSKNYRNHENSALLELLDQSIRGLSVEGWEIGSGSNAECSLTLSPEGDVERLEVTERIVRESPNIPGREFHAARPPKKWDLKFSIEKADGELLKIDARSWRYVFYRFPDGTVDVVLEQNGLSDVSDDERYLAAVLAIDGQLGELLRLRVVGQIEPVERLKGDEPSKASCLSDIAKHINLETTRHG